MSKSNKMFEKLGYENSQDGVCVLYRRKDFNSLCNLDISDITFFADTEIIYIETQVADVIVNKGELRAIAQKAKELGWV